MNTPDQPRQLRLAASIIETGHPWERYSNHKQRWLKSALSPAVAVTHSDPIRIVLATPPDGRPLHNPDDLTAEQVGVGHRLILEGEPFHEHAEYWNATDKKWEVTTMLGGYNSLFTYRLPLSTPWPEAPKPEPPPFQLPTPPPGIQWHRTDGWKYGDLPPGYRPHINGERDVHGDEWKPLNGVKWHTCNGTSIAPSSECSDLYRTTRPLTFTHEGKQWTYHRPGDPMPCERERQIEIVDLKGSIRDCNGEIYLPRAAFANVWEKTLGWRYADPETIPLGPEDVPPGSVVRRKSRKPNSDHWTTISAANFEAVVIGDKFTTYAEMKENLEINRSIPLTGKWNPVAWEPCHKPAPQNP